MITVEHSAGCDKVTPRSPEDPTICCQGEVKETEEEIENEAV